MELGRGEGDLAGARTRCRRTWRMERGNMHIGGRDRKVRLFIRILRWHVTCDLGVVLLFVEFMGMG